MTKFDKGILYSVWFWEMTDYIALIWVVLVNACAPCNVSTVISYI